MQEWHGALLPTAVVGRYRGSMTRADRSPTTGVDAIEVVHDYLDEFRLRESDAQRRSGRSHAARRLDLCRWGALIGHVQGRRGMPERFTVEDSFAGVDLAEFADLDLLMRALAAARAESATDGSPRYASATLARMLSTLRGFTAWLAAQGLAADVSSNPRLSVARSRRRELRALDDDAVAALAATAGGAPPPRSRMWWPSRDVAIVEVLAGCGLRASELCDAKVGWITRDGERPLLDVVGKGDKSRRVPVPGRVDAALGAWLADRRVRSEGTPALAVHPDSGLFLRVDGRRLDLSFLDRLIRGLADRAGVALPARAAAHSLRHHYGATMARRGVHVPLMQQAMGHASADTTAVYTRVSERHLIAAFDDAGMLD